MRTFNAYTAVGADDPSAEINKGEWNADYLTEMPTGHLVGRTTGGDGENEDIAVTSRFLLSGLALDLAAESLGYYNAKTFGGAVGDGTTSDRTALQDLFDDVPAGNTIYFPKGHYYLTGTGTELLLLEKNCPLVFDQDAWLLIDSAVGGTVDVLRVLPGVNWESWGIWGMNIHRDGVAFPARHALNLDVTSFAISYATLNRCSFGPVGGRSIILTGAGSDKFFTSEISRGKFYNGLDLDGCGDSVWILFNTFVGHTSISKCAIDITQPSGAAQIKIEGNNCTMKGGFLRMANGIQPKIRDNQIEQTLATSMSESAQIALGLSANVTGATIMDNNLGANANCTRNIYLGDADNTYIAANEITSKGSSDFLTITASATNTLCGFRNIHGDTNCTISNSGTGSRTVSTASM